MTQLPEVPAGFRVATFAGGCFWCMEHPFDVLEGVHATIAGYTGGHVANPSYEQVCAGDTGHAEAVWILYDPEKTSYRELLEVFWRQIDPTKADGQFCDLGSSYRPAIFYHDEDQRRHAETFRDRLEQDSRFENPIVTEIVPAKAFWPAEAYHQDFYRKNPSHYRRYREASGRDDYLKKVWGEG